MTKAQSPSKQVNHQSNIPVTKTFKARSIGGTGVVRFHSHMHWIPEGHEDETETIATCTPFRSRLRMRRVRRDIRGRQKDGRDAS
jgi:hypothetical protein